jgi:hypothetical protein
MSDEPLSKSLQPPDLSAEVLGFRGWKVAPSGLLMSAGVSDGWLPGENYAACSRGLHPAPQKGCGCGLYAHYSLEDLSNSVNWGDESGTIVGAVSGWGRVILHPDGWRAQYARVLALFRQGPAAALERAEQVYNVPVVAGPLELEHLGLEAETVKDSMKPEPEGPKADGQLGGGPVGGAFATGGALPGGGIMSVGTMMPRGE